MTTQKDVNILQNDKNWSTESIWDKMIVVVNYGNRRNTKRGDLTELQKIAKGTEVEINEDLLKVTFKKTAIKNLEKEMCLHVFMKHA